MPAHLSRPEPDRQAQRHKMLETPIPPLVCSLAAPTIASMLVTAIYNMADTYYVSQINTSASGAVGIVFSVMAIIQAVGFTVGMGTGSIASRLLGQDRGEEANVYASSGVLTALVLGIALAAFGMGFRGDIMWLLGSTETIYPYAMDYAFYIMLGCPVMILSFTLNNLMRWQGKANLAVIGLGIGGILNMILDPIFIFGFHMGIGGAGAATLLSQCISMGILISFFVTGRSELQVSVVRISKDPLLYLGIFKQGMPSFFRQGVMSLATMALNYNARVYGDAAVAALAIVAKIFMVVNSVIIGFGQGFQPVLGFNYGAGRMDRVKQSLLFSLKVCTVFLIISAVAGFILSPQLIALFRRDDPEVIAIGTVAFRFQCVTLPLGAVNIFANMFFQALGKSFRASVLALFRHGIYIPVVFLFARQFGLTGLECSQAVADLFAFVVAAGIIITFYKFEFQSSG